MPVRFLEVERSGAVGVEFEFELVDIEEEVLADTDLDGFKTFIVR